MADAKQQNFLMNTNLGYTKTVEASNGISFFWGEVVKSWNVFG